MRNATILALVAIATLIALACGGDGDDQPASATSTQPPAATATAPPDISAVFPVVLESETLIVASADGSRITETPLEPGERQLFVADVVSPNGRYTVLVRDGTLLIQEGDGEPRPVILLDHPGSVWAAWPEVWSPDGSRLGVLAVDESSDVRPGTLYVLNADGSEQVNVSGDVDASSPIAWSPDGERISFLSLSREIPVGSAGTLFTVRADGSELTAIGEVPSGPLEVPSNLPRWSPDGAWIAAAGGLVLDSTGGPPIQLGASGVQSSWSPDSRSLAVGGTFPGGDVMLIDIASPAGTRFLTEGFWPRWSPDGERIAFKRDGQVYTIRRDGTGLAALGEYGQDDLGELSWSEDGREVEWVQGAPSAQHLYAVDLRDGTVVRTPASLTEAGYDGPGYSAIELAPSAEQVAFQVSVGKEGQNAPGWFTMDVDTGELTKVADDPRSGGDAGGDDVYWSSEGLRIAYSASGGGVRVTNSDGSTPRQVSGMETFDPMRWSPDGRSLAFMPFQGGADLHIVDVETTAVTTIAAGFNDESDSIAALEWSSDGMRILFEVIHQISTGIARETFMADLDGTPAVSLLAPEAMAAEATWSPDGEVIAYALVDDAAAEVWLMNAEGGDQRLLTSFESSFSVSQLRWSPDGSRIAVVSGNSDVYVIDVENGASLFVATSAVVCSTNLLGWSPDSQRLFVVPRCEFQAGH